MHYALRCLIQVPGHQRWGDRIKISEIECRQIISVSNLPESDYVINPYIGCSHGCIYCYARFMKRFTGHDEEWGHFLDVKVNAPDTIPFAGSKYEKKRIFLSSVTDPYLHLEKRYELTRRILQKLIPLNPDLSVQSKSDLILRDIDLFTKFEKCSVGVTITSTDESLRREIEKHASPYSRRIDAIKSIKSEKINTHIFIGPIIPLFTDWKEIIEATYGFADFYYIENLNVVGSIRKDITYWIRTFHPEMAREFLFLVDNTDYWNCMEAEIEEFVFEKGINAKICFHHGKK